MQNNHQSHCETNNTSRIHHSSASYLPPATPTSNNDARNTMTLPRSYTVATARTRHLESPTITLPMPMKMDKENATQRHEMQNVSTTTSVEKPTRVSRTSSLGAAVSAASAGPLASRTSLVDRDLSSVAATAAQVAARSGPMVPGPSPFVGFRDFEDRFQNGTAIPNQREDYDTMEMDEIPDPNDLSIDGGDDTEMSQIFSMVDGRDGATLQTRRSDGGLDMAHENRERMCGNPMARVLLQQANIGSSPSSPFPSSTSSSPQARVLSSSPASINGSSRPCPLSRPFATRSFDSYHPQPSVSQYPYKY